MITDRFNWYAKVMRVVVGNDLQGIPDRDENIFDVWGELIPRRGSEYEAGQQIQSQTTHEFNCWMTEPPISQHHWLDIQGQRFDVLEAKNVVGGNMFQTLMLRQIDNGI